MNNIQVFENKNFGQVRMIELEGKPFAVGVDVARALEYSNPNKAILDHCKGDFLTWEVEDSLGRKQNTRIIPEGDIYRLIVKAASQSKNKEIKKKAEKFERWIFDEVIPELRKTGSYSVPASNSLKAIKLVNQQVGALLGTVEQIDQRVEFLEDTMTVDFSQQRRLQNKAKSKAIATLGGMNSLAYKNNSVRGKVFSAIWRDYKDYFMVASYRDTARKEFDKGLEFLENWQPQGKLLREIDEANSQLELQKVI